MRIGFGIVVGLVVALVGGSASAVPVPADLAAWVAESYDSQDQFAGPGVWNVSPDGSFVVEEENGAPTLFVSNQESVRYRITTTFNLPAEDDDFVGVVLGFSPGESIDPAADYLLIDWKQQTQLATWEGVPLPGVLGFAVSRIQGVPLLAEMWGHVDVPEPSGSVTEIARGATLGGVGWTSGASHELVLEYTSNRLVVWVDGVLQVDLVGDFPAGPFAVYDFSQPGASFSDITFEELNAPPTVLNGGASDASAPEGSTAATSGAFTDADEDVLALSCSGLCDGFAGSVDGTWTWSMPIVDDLAPAEVAITASDGRTTTSDSFMVTGTNLAPIIGSSAPSATRVNVNTPFTVSGAFTDAGVLDSHIGTVSWSDGSNSPADVVSANGAGTFSATHEYSQPGSYQVTVTITDDDGGSDSVTHTVDVFNADDFVTGGGWVTSPVAAVLGGPEHTGKATFGFVAKYRKDGIVGGNLTLQVHKAFMFKATSFSSLDIADGTAVFTGLGEIDGSGSVAFTVVAVDERFSPSSTDTFWITIEGVYDGGSYPAGGLPITGKGIQIHDR